MNSVTTIGHGTEFHRSTDGTAPNLAALGELISIDGMSVERSVVDATSFSSTERYRELIAGMRNAGEVTVTIALDPDGSDHANALSDLAADAPGLYAIIFPDTSDWQFSAFLTSHNEGIPIDDRMTLELTYAITGKPTFTAAP